MNKKIKWVLTFVGLVSFLHIVEGYGHHALKEEIQKSGLFLTLIILTFIPTLICYSLSWMLATEHHLMKGDLGKKLFIFTKITTMSIAWNNLTPFLKIGGEPLKYLMLKEHLSKKEAINSTITYNIIHLLATALSFVIGASILILFFPISREASLFLYCLILFLLSLFGVGYFIVQKRWAILTNIRQKTFRKILVNLYLIKKRLLDFCEKYPKAFLSSLFFDTLARFIEGLTFYFGFLLIQKPIGFLTASCMDIARTLADTIFFFIPYQVGSREQGVQFFMERVLQVNSTGFLTATLYYRLVEIAWMFIGYILWRTAGKTVKEEIV